MKNTFRTILAVLSAALLLACCTKKEDPQEAPYLTVEPSQYDSALGDGDGFLLKISSNVAWTIDCSDETGGLCDWVILDATEGKGDASIFGIIKRGSRSGERDCQIVVTPSDKTVPAVVLALKQGIFVPVMINSTLGNAIKSVATEPVGKAVELDDYTVFDVLVVAKSDTPNLPVGGCIIVTDNGSYARMNLPDVSKYNVGDSLHIEQTGGMISHDSAAGYTLDIVEPAVLLSSGAALPDPAFIPGASLAAYENALVKLGPCQAQDAFVGKGWNGTVTFDQTADEGSFDATVEGAQFVPSMPGEQGYLTGIVVDGKLRPVSSDGIVLNKPRGQKYVPQTFAIKPVINIMHCTATNTIGNATVVDKNGIEFTADEGWSVAGASIMREDGANGQFACVAAAASLYHSCFTTKAWSVGSYLTFKVPVDQKVYGDLEFGCSVNHGTAGNLPWTWEINWSTDGKTWKPVSHVYNEYEITEAAAKGTTYVNKNNSHANNRYVAEFNIPESEALNAGDALYFRVMLTKITKLTASLTVRMNVGSYLATCVSDTPVKEYDSILAMENFDGCRSGMTHILGGSIGYLHNEGVSNAYKSNYGFGAVGTLRAGRGYCWCNVATATPVYLVSPQLTKLKGATDITVSFKCALFEGQDGTKYDDHIQVGVTGAGKVGDLVWDKPLKDDYFTWHTCTCTIKGADATTQVNIGNISGETGGSLFYLDDVIITK